MAICISITKREPPENDLETDIGRLKKGELDIDELIEDHGWGDDAFRIAKMMEAGDLPFDAEKCWNLKVRAARKGNRDAALEALSSPRNSFEDPTAYGSDRYNILDTLEEKNPDLYEELRAMAETDGNIAASFAMFSEHLFHDVDLCDYCGKTDPSFDADMHYL